MFFLGVLVLGVFPISTLGKSFSVSDKTASSTISNVRCIKDPNQRDSGVFVSKRRFSPGVWALEFSHYPPPIKDARRLHGEILGPEPIIKMVKDFCQYGFKIRRADKTSNGTYIMAPSARVNRAATPFDKTDLFQYCEPGCVFTLTDKGVIVEGGDDSKFSSEATSDNTSAQNSGFSQTQLLGQDTPESSHLQTEGRAAPDVVMADESLEINTAPVGEMIKDNSDVNPSQDSEFGLHTQNDTTQSRGSVDYGEKEGSGIEFVDRFMEYVDLNGVGSVGIVVGIIIFSSILLIGILIWDVKSRKKPPPVVFGMPPVDNDGDSQVAKISSPASKGNELKDKEHKLPPPKPVTEASPPPVTNGHKNILRKSNETDQFNIRISELEEIIKAQNEQLSESQKLVKNLADKIDHQNEQDLEAQLIEMHKKKLKELDLDTEEIVENQWPKRKKSVSEKAE